MLFCSIMNEGYVTVWGVVLLNEDFSLVFAKKNKKEITRELVMNKEQEVIKTAIFMAGSPGAGKTEVVQTLIPMNNNLVVIDADQFRKKFPGYTGNNSDVFQSGSTLLVDASLDLVLKKGYSFVLDGTFATPKVKSNIERALKRDYNVLIYYVYQDPLVAWEFTKKREKIEGRYVPKERFINAFFQSRDNLLKIKELCKDLVTINIFVKNFQNEISDSIMDIENIELALPIKYTREGLEEMLHD